MSAIGLKTWTARELRRLAPGRASIRRYAELAQGKVWRIRELLLVNAVETSRLPLLMGAVKDPELRLEYERVGALLGSGTFSELADDSSLPERYRKLLLSWHAEANAPSRRLKAKREAARALRTKAAAGEVRLGELSRELGIDKSNLCAFVNREQLGRISLKDAWRALACTAPKT